MPQVDFTDGQPVQNARLYSTADERRINPFDAKRFYMLSRHRIQVLAQFSGTRLLAMLYFADRASSPRFLTSLTWHKYAIDCAPGLTAKALERATEGLLAAGHLEPVSVTRKKTVYCPASRVLCGNVQPKDFHRFTASERRWIASTLLSRGERLKGHALLVYLWVAWYSGNPTRSRYHTRNAYTIARAVANLNTFVQELEGCRPVTTGAFKKAVRLLTQLGVVKELYARGHKRFHTIRWPAEFEQYMNTNELIQLEARSDDGTMPNLHTAAREARKRKLPAKALLLIQRGWGVKRLQGGEYEVATPDGIVYRTRM